MKQIYFIMRNKLSRRSKQARVIDFVESERAEKRAMQGSIEKRLDLFREAAAHKSN
jgi:hypothetical protein